MFTGIIEEVGYTAKAHDGTLVVKASTVLPGSQLGDSVSVNGACLTVTDIDSSGFAVDVVPETLRRTNLGGLLDGSPVNLERSLKFGGRVGGHLVQGHVDGVATLETSQPEGEALMARFAIPQELSRYVAEKGFIAVEGVSLTIIKTGVDWFTVTLVPFTRQHTNLGTKKPGETFNIEVDILAKYTERLMATRS